jgi:protein-L-isoaspartate(D-aspartate) O-methyltransferase
MMPGEDRFADERLRMVREQVERRGIREPRLLEALRSVPRHCFVPEDERDKAYLDGPLPIAEGQTISQPYIVAAMTGLLEIVPEDNVLEIGTGSGYQAAILGKLAKTVHSVERHPLLARQAGEVLESLGLHNVIIHVGDGSLGLEECAPYQGIIVTAASPCVPQQLLNQLAPNGRLVIPVGGREGQSLQRWRRLPEGFEHEELFPVVFVPLRGSAGWKEEDWNGRSDWF